jgi:murein DD-endopeptidase MepM/ murein hydrolase activator NlpD
MVENPKIELKGYLPKVDKPEQQDKALKKSCRDFESLLMHQLLKTMRRTVEKCDLFHGGQGEEIYESLLDMELSKSMSGLGPNSLAEILYQQLKRPTVLGTQQEPPDTHGAGPSGPEQVQLPIKATVSSSFGWRKDPINGEKKFHYGLDFAAPKGSPVKAAMAGRVVFSGKQRGYGNVIILDHGGDLKTVYAHNERNAVGEGDWVKGGSIIAQVGTSGRSTGPHLHFEVRKGMQAVDPFQVLSSLGPAQNGA